MPDQAIGLKQLLANHTRGLSANFIEGEYFEEQEIPQILDLNDLQDIKESAEENKREIERLTREQIKKENEALTEAEIKRRVAEAIKTQKTQQKQPDAVTEDED